MTDMREKEPPERVVHTMQSSNYEIVISAWPYSSLKSEDVISRKLIYREQSETFGEASRIAAVLRDTVQAIHDIWVAKVVSVSEWKGDQ